ncbi:HD domain-containing phosphohydrolase [Actinotalea sp. JY-7876]|uniref:HD domain-containing phosphohydrolase n=3 Tax=unclassified Actinotalea TaxID=2638618 RepID=UPI0015F56BFA|nr:HD domain-containing phosphohydrolase [Actinotalea sp. JY-7876]
MASGPTQNYDDASLGAWRPRPVLAAAVRTATYGAPVLVTLGFGAAAVRWFPPSRLGLDPWLWLLLEVLCATALVMGTGAALRRLLPLSALLRLTAYFPDRAPSRLAVARRTYSPAALETGTLAAPGDHARLLLDLVRRLDAHDRTTFRHSERVQAYSALIGERLGLSRDDLARLAWAALLHDVGKLAVPVPVLTKAGRPDDAEWATLAEHPARGGHLVASLAPWLGSWTDAVAQHHERWDGAGYPTRLAGTQISLAARIVAVADAFDVITSARPYKKPLSAAAARAELTRCAGTQFDPAVVRALLAVGLVRLRLVAGPVSALAALPGLRAVPDAAGAVPSLAAATTSAVVAAGLVVAAPVLAPAPHDQGTVGSSAHATPTGAPAALAARGASAPGGSPGASTAPDDAAGSAPGAEVAADADQRDVASAGTSAEAGTAPAEPTPDAAPATTVAGPPSAGAAPGAPAAPSARPATHGPSSAAPGPAPAKPAPPVTSPQPGPAARPCERARAGATDLRGADLAGCDLSGLALTGTWAGAKLNGASLVGATLVDLDLTGARLQGADLTRATVTRVRFDDADLQGATFRDATVTGSSFTGAAKARSALAGAHVDGAPHAG